MSFAFGNAPRHTDEPIASEDLLFLSHHLLARPAGRTGDVPIEIILNRNVFLRESIFRYWQRDFLAKLAEIARAGSLTAQRRLLAGFLLDEIEWKTLHAAAAAAEAEDDPKVLALLLSGVDWFDPEETGSRRYAVDTRKWVSRLSVRAFEFLAAEVFSFDAATFEALEDFRRAALLRADRIVLRATSREDADLRRAEGRIRELRSALCGRRATPSRGSAERPHHGTRQGGRPAIPAV